MAPLIHILHLEDDPADAELIQAKIEADLNPAISAVIKTLGYGTLTQLNRAVLRLENEDKRVGRWAPPPRTGVREPGCLFFDTVGFHFSVQIAALQTQQPCGTRDIPICFPELRKNELLFVLCPCLVERGCGRG